jgi:hypothetical protein
MRKIAFILSIVVGCCSSAWAQLERVLVERYYVADSLDATDTIGGGVEQGAVTYRIYMDLLPGAQLLEIYGDADHPFRIESTAPFFNNVDGATFGFEIPKVSYESNTVALDSYLTLGQTGYQGVKTYFGLPKDQDTDGSFIGGVNNDGGSEMIDGGLLINADITAGIPLTQADGMDTLNWSIQDWFNFGVLDFASGADSTIFGTTSQPLKFESTNFSLRNSGVVGVEPDSNAVLVAQVTTMGELSFTLNARVAVFTNGDTLVYTYVGTNTVNEENQFFNAFLNYPQLCGCQDPNYLEYNSAFACSEEGACVTPNVIGCMDTLACNYDPQANVNVDLLCCYPGFCANLDIEEVCPQLKGNTFDVDVYPNPTQNELVLQVLSGVTSDVEYVIYNYYGIEMASRSISQAPLNYVERLDVSAFNQGIYQVKVSGVDGDRYKIFVKL